MKQWLERHAQTSIGSLGRLWQHPFATLLTVIVIGIALALPACLHVLVQNVRHASGGWNNALDISVYLKPDASLDQAQRAADRIRQRRDVGEVHLIEADSALKEFRRNSGFGEALDALKDNPLPHALIVRPGAEYRDDARVQALTEDLRKIEIWTARHGVALADWPDKPVDPFFNVNTPEDAARAEQLAKEFPEA